MKIMCISSFKYFKLLTQVVFQSNYRLVSSEGLRIQFQILTRADNSASKVTATSQEFNLNTTYD